MINAAQNRFLEGLFSLGEVIGIMVRISFHLNRLWTTPDILKKFLENQNTKKREIPTFHQ